MNEMRTKKKPLSKRKQKQPEVPLSVKSVRLMGVGVGVYGGKELQASIANERL